MSKAQKSKNFEFKRSRENLCFLNHFRRMVPMQAVSRVFTLVMGLALISEVHVINYDSKIEFEPYVHEDMTNFMPYVTDEEYIRHIHSVIRAYRGDITGGRLIETNALVDTKYRTWKRNADLINSLLGLPKGMNDAGR